jgi:hypothetical protein
MKALIYNLCGFGSGGYRMQLKDYMKQHHLDVIGLQETIRQDLSAAELHSLHCGGQFVWNWLSADRQSGDYS